MFALFFCFIDLNYFGDQPNTELADYIWSIGYFPAKFGLKIGNFLTSGQSLERETVDNPPVGLLRWISGLI